MAERVKRKVMPWLVAVMLAAFLGMAGFALLGTESVGASANTSTSAAADGMEEETQLSTATTTGSNITTGKNSSNQNYWTFNYSGAVQTITLTAGKYRFQLYGAQGGTGSSNKYRGGYGGYTVGELSITATTKFFVYVGGVGNSAGGSTAGGFNGGGASGYNNTVDMSTGGGATDIRVVADSLYNRILVAGGGGGGAYNGGIGIGGDGGGANGTTPSTASGSGKGATQNAAGAAPSAGNGSAGTFGVGGVSGNSSSSGGGGGGGGWYGGSGGTCGNGSNNGGGGGGSGYVLTSSSYKPSGYFSQWSTYVFSSGSTSTSTRTGNGVATITELNSPVSQGTAPTFTVQRSGSQNISISSLNVSDSDGDSIRFGKAGVYVLSGGNYLDATTAANGYYLKANPAPVLNSTSNFIITPAKWWSGTQTFYVCLQDYNTAGNANGTLVWVSFKVQMTTPTLSVKTGTSGNLKFGVSDTTSVSQAESNLYNPLGTNRNTIYVTTPISQGGSLDITASTIASISNTTENRLMWYSSVTYGTNRYSNTTGAVQAISTAVAGSNSSYFTKVTPNTAVPVTYWSGSTVTSNYQSRGYSKATISGVAGVAAGPYYYTITLRVAMICYYSGVEIAYKDIDVVYQLDNTRPELLAPAVLSVQSGTTASVTLDKIIRDPDNNTLTIRDVVVPSGEVVLVDQYKNVKTANASNFNYGITASTWDDTQGNAQNASQPTGFSPELIYRDSSFAGADSSFSSSQQATQGDASKSYLGYYVNTARNELFVYGNKVTRNMYKAGRANALGDFYILLRIEDSGDPNDTAIWFPVAVKVTSAAPTAANYPSVNGTAGQSFYFTPFGVQDTSSAVISYYGIGSYTKDFNNIIAKNGSVNSDNTVIPLAYDRDNLASSSKSVGTAVTTYSYNGATVQINTPVTDTDKTLAQKAASYAQNDLIFIRPYDSKYGAGHYSANNSYLFDTLGNRYEPNSPITNYDYGYKEFFTVNYTSLYASTSILSNFTKDEIDFLVNNGYIEFEQLGNYWCVKYTGLKVTLNKYTMGKYLSFYVDVADSFGVKSTIRVAVNVQNVGFSGADGLTSASIRNDKAEGGNTAANYLNTRNGKITRYQYNTSIAFDVHIKVNDVIRISPYDLFYDPDTYTLDYDKTTPDGSDGHTNTMLGINKAIWVKAADTPSAEPASVNNFGFEKLTINAAAQHPSVSGGGVYGNVTYIGETDQAEHFEIQAIHKTPSQGYLSFNYTVTASSGESITAEIHVYVDNSLPIVRNDIVTLFNLSASVNLEKLNSSEEEPSTGNDYFVINSNTYNVREFTLADLLVDPDGDTVQFYSVNAGIKVGTKLVDGTFVEFTDEQNVYINAYIGSGTNNRTGYNNCIIIQGLSSTQGVPGGVWIMFDAIDNAIGSNVPATFYFQVEVYNSAPAYADFTQSDNSLDVITNADGTPIKDVNGNTRYLWKGDSEETSLKVASTFGIADVKYPSGASVGTGAVEKPMYIASNRQAMLNYQEFIRNPHYDGTGGGETSFAYSDSQVRYIADDADEGQGLVLWGNDYHGVSTNITAQSFNVVNDINATNIFSSILGQNNNYAVAVTPMYAAAPSLSYYAENGIVQLVFFDGEGKRTTDAAITNTTTSWVIAFNFTDTPQVFDVKLRLRDSNNTFNIDYTLGDDDDETYSISATEGGYSAWTDTSNAYEGVRHVVSGEFEPNTRLSALGGNVKLENGKYVGTGEFGLTVRKSTLGLYNNFSKWSSNGSVNYNGTDYSLDKVWAITAQKGDDPNYVWTYYDIAPTTVNTNGLFKYDGISVPAGSSSVSVPLSYFAWPTRNTAAGHAGSGQTRFAWYNINNFVYGDSQKVAATNTAFMSAVSLTDGYNTWTGANLNSNPYITFSQEYEAQPDNENSNYGKWNNRSITNNYLFGQQRISVVDGTISNIPVANTIKTEDTEETRYFMEDCYGIRLRKNSIRSVGTLYMSINLTYWEYSSSIYTADTDQAITVTVPITVANTPLEIPAANTVVDLTTSSSVGGVVVALTTNSDLDSKSYVTGTKMIASNPTHDQTQVANAAGITYREDMYFLSDSLTGMYSYSLPAVYGDVTETATGLSAKELEHIKSVFPSITDQNMQKRILDYFGVNNGDELEEVEVAEYNGKLQLMRGAAPISVNPYFLNYFDVSPSGVDSKSITITPSRITTFDYSKYSTQTAITNAAKERGLEVVFTSDSSENSPEVDYCYYALKMIVYDRLAVGRATNTTDFFNSSFDVVTINVRVINSAPTVITRNLTEELQPAGENVLPGRTISLAKNQQISYYFTEIISDADMVVDNNTGSYKTGEAITKAGGIDAETGDYLKRLDSGRLVDIKFIAAKNGVTNEYNPTTKLGAIECTATDVGITINVRNRAEGFSAGDVATYIKLTFEDNYGDKCSAVIAVKISNAAPTLTANATDVRSITMKTGDYFTLYTTPYDKFIEGAGISSTVGSLQANNTYNGTYFTQTMTSEQSWNSKNLSNGIAKWSYSEGINIGGSYQNKPISDIAIGIDEWSDPNYSLNNSSKRNLGYMAIAEDDAAWTLRIPTSASAVTVGSSMIQPHKLNETVFEGGKAGTTGYTAVMFEALGACSDVTVSVTVTDGHASIEGDTPYSVIYTFKITVDSTPPTAITAESEKTSDIKLGASLKGTEWASRLEHNTAGQTENNNVYNLKMFVGESITLKTGDFATDKDSGDTANLYLLPRNGDNPFSISGTFGTASDCITLSMSGGSTQRRTQFTVTANNFMNEVSSSALYEEVEFYICDPYFTDVSGSVLIKLYVYVYPSEVNASGTTTTINVKGVTQAEQDNAAQEVVLVSSDKDGGGLFYDKDAGSSLTRYSVRVYTLNRYTNYADKTIENLSSSKFSTLSVDEKANQLVAEYNITGKTDVIIPATFRTQNSEIVREYIGSISFSDDGTVMYLMPRKATNSARNLIYGAAESQTGFQLAIEVEKYVERDNTSDYGPGMGNSEPSYGRSILATVRVSNSAPIDVKNTDLNHGALIDGHPYLSVDGQRGDSWNYLLYNTLTDTALFRDPDGDEITYAGSAVVDVYVLDEYGYKDETNNYFANAEVKAAADKAYTITEIGKIDYVVPGSSDDAQVISGKFNAIKLTIVNKIALPGNAKGDTVYVDIQVYGKDAYGTTAPTIITLGIKNSTPSFKSETQIAEKYNSGLNSYSFDANTGDARLTLTLNKDNSDKFITNDGSVTIPLMDLITDADYNTDATQNNEYFSFVSAGMEAGNRADMRSISGNSAITMWLSDNSHGVSDNNASIANRNFWVRVRDDNNTAIIFTVNSYERGASEQLVMVVSDTSGATTGTLTITLVIGNSAPTDLTRTGEVSGKIVLAGGKTGTGNNDTFEAQSFNIRNFVRDNNPDDNAEFSAEPAEATNYLRITGYTPGLISFDPASDFSEYIGGDGNGDSSSSAGGALDQPQSLVNFIYRNQEFSIAPLKNLYGKQTITLTVTDGGNSNGEDSETIRVEIEITITKNPDDMDTHVVNVFWKQTAKITPAALFDDPETDDKDESEGLLVKRVTIASDPDHAVTINEPSDKSSDWTVYGELKEKEVSAVAEVIVGTDLSESAVVYYKNFIIKVGDNEKPEFRFNDSGVKYDEGITWVSKGDINDDGIWEVAISRIFYDKEGDDIKLVSAKSKVSTLIDVTADTQNNKLIFNFKSRGETTIEVKIRDAVATYSYTFMVGNTDLPAPNFFIGVISRVQQNPFIFIVIGCGIILFLIILIAIIAAVRKKKKMRAEIEALLVSEMELEEQMLKLAAGPSPTFYQSYGYLPPTQNNMQNPGLMLGGGQGAPNPNAAIGLNPGAPQGGAQQAPAAQLPPADDGFSDDDL